MVKANRPHKGPLGNKLAISQAVLGHDDKQEGGPITNTTNPISTETLALPDFSVSNSGSARVVMPLGN